MKKELGIIYLAAFAESQEQRVFAYQQAFDWLVKKKVLKELPKQPGQYRLTNKFQNNLQKWFDIKFKENVDENSGQYDFD